MYKGVHDIVGELNECTCRT